MPPPDFAGGTRPADFNELIFQYVLKLREMVGRHAMRLMVMQGPLANTGYLAGLGPVIGKMPKDIVIGSYYTAMGIYPGWEKDFPLLRRNGIDFFAQSWIWSHCWLMPEVSGSMRCSDAEVTRGLEHGAVGQHHLRLGRFRSFSIGWADLVPERLPCRQRLDRGEAGSGLLQPAPIAGSSMESKTTESPARSRCSATSTFNR